MMVLFFAVMGITPLVIAGLGILNFRSESRRQTRMTLQALGALVLWVILSLVVVIVFIKTVFRDMPQSGEIANILILFGGGLTYFAFCGALIYWTRRQKKRMPGMGISC
jgi:TRAP-type C4-dicarboxylate transport system permease small subunit